MMIDEGRLDMLQRVAELPTAPFHEQHVANFIKQRLVGLRFRVNEDVYGNVYARLTRGGPAQSLVFVAHMDHPGLEVTHVIGNEVIASVLGGVPEQALTPGGSFVLHRGDAPVHGHVIEFLPAVGRMRSLVRLQSESFVPEGVFATLDLEPIVQVKDYLAMRAADDLAQCAALLSIAERLAASDEPLDVTFLFTRAEEVGLVGAALAAQSGDIRPESFVISLECSRALPGAELGGGPVIRTGDAEQSFDPAVEDLLLRARDQFIEQAKKRCATPPGVQRQLMSGGRCEATAFRHYGYAVGGICLPLGNYHNADIDRQVSPEFISLDDYVAHTDFLLAVIAEAAQRGTPRRRTWLQHVELYTPRMRSQESEPQADQVDTIRAS